MDILLHFNSVFYCTDMGIEFPEKKKVRKFRFSTYDVAYVNHSLLNGHATIMNERLKVFITEARISLAEWVQCKLTMFYIYENE